MSNEQTLAEMLDYAREVTAAIETAQKLGGFATPADFSKLRDELKWRTEMIVAGAQHLKYTNR